MRTDTSERGLERLICTALTGHPCDPPQESRAVEARLGYGGGAGWSGGNPHDYDREFCVDRVQLAAFLKSTQPDAAESLALDEDGPTRRKFLARLQGEITKRGTIDVLRHGLRHGAHDLDLFYGTPSPGNVQAQQRFEQNRFTVVRQLRYSRDETQRALDIGLFLNGLPVFTFELKNSLTKQTVNDAVWQYQKDRNPREKLFEFGRCVVDESDVRFCTHLKGKASWFLPFNRGWNDGAGNPPNPSGIKTDYLWREVLTRESLTDILENYAQVVEAKDEKTGKKKRTQIWPRYQQLDVVRRLLADAATHGAGRRYLIQHSAGSGKSNSIAWLAHQLIGLAKDDASTFDSIIVVTDRRILDRQIRDTIKQYAQVGATVGHAERAGDLRRFIEAGKKIIISTVQKFPFILDEIGNEQRGQRFAIIIDEAHSSQGGRTSASISAALGTAGEEAEEETTEDHINRLMESRRLLPNASSALRQELEDRPGAHGRQEGYARPALRYRARRRSRVLPGHPLQRRSDALPRQQALEDEAGHAARQPHRRGAQRQFAVHRRCRPGREQHPPLDYRERLAGGDRRLAFEHVLQHRHRHLHLGADQP